MKVELEVPAPLERANEDPYDLGFSLTKGVGALCG